MDTLAARPRLFTRDREFYSTIKRLMITIILQNVVAYSVNMADNIMLGTYSQSALSGAATVNQIQFIVQQITIALGDGIVVIGAQYWGQKRTGPIKQLTFYSLFLGLIFGMGIFAWVTAAPETALTIFTSNEEYISEGVRYLRLIRFTYPIFIVTTVLLASLRTVETVKIALHVSWIALVVNVCINYTLIFGKFGFPEMGIVGAAVGTLVSRIVELGIVVCYMIFKDKKLQLFKFDRSIMSLSLVKDYLKVLIPGLLTSILWGLATPIQTAVLGRLSDDAIAANSVSTTIYNYLKIVAAGEASASGVLMGRTVGESGGKNIHKIKEYSNTLQMLYIISGVVMSVAIFLLRVPFLKLYSLSPNALEIADGMLIVLSVVMFGMSYQMPASVGIVKGGGDPKYLVYLNLFFIWCVVMPLSFLAAFVWHFPPVWVVACLNCDQILKCIPVAFRCNRYRWIKDLTK